MDYSEHFQPSSRDLPNVLCEKDDKNPPLKPTVGTITVISPALIAGACPKCGVPRTGVSTHKVTASLVFS